MKRYIPYLAFFGLFFIGGLWAGRQIGFTLLERQRHPASFPPGSFPVPPPGLPLPEPMAGSQQQRTMLALSVDRLDSQAPKLEGVWLIMYLPALPRVTVMPLYPTIRNEESGITTYWATELAENFGLVGDNQIDPNFLDELHIHAITWDYYLVLDRHALARVIDRLEGLPGYPLAASSLRPGRGSRGDQILAQLKAPRTDPVDHFLSQVQLAQEICRSAGHLPAQAERLADLFQELQPHLQSDLPPLQFAVEWTRILQAGGRISCEFPSLALAAIP